MSEDVKPRKFTLERYGHTYYHNKVTLAHYKTYLDVDELMPENKLPRADTIKAIELEPTMRLMDEMAETMMTASPYEYNDFSKALEKYKKFKEGLKCVRV